MKKQKCSKCKQPMELLTGTKNRSGIYHLAWVCRKWNNAKKDKLYEKTLTWEEDRIIYSVRR